MDPINELINNSWEERFENHSLISTKHLAKTLVPNLNQLIQRLIIEEETNYSYDELFSYGFFGLIAAITADEKTNYDTGEIMEKTHDYLVALINAEKELAGYIPFNECARKDCLGKECAARICNSFLSNETNEKEHMMLAIFSDSQNYLNFLNVEEAKQKEQKGKVLTLDLYRKKRV